ncbi:Capsule biosynthesis protein CapC [Rubripirellula obstinata]|uniref:Capsule biosynthesis protein CapC n=1 Tax=Rubripirellula obstinata TaxID=406547 RepID=A0A5B1CKS0_9BACT|nr:poly-gamma-glutamate biosynthesis protein PgsC [Rubripirellula obstinata]KAA1260475.1 Capsule biosynthesis protein CapC [Rubripirellula obstinata]
MEWVAVSIGLGLIVSLLFTEAFGLSVGGMIVPGYLALHFDRPGTVVATIAAAILTFVVVRFVSKHAIVFGRRRVVLTMLIGFAIGESLRQAFLWYTSYSIANDPTISDTTSSLLQSAGSSIDVADASVSVIGFVIPGLIALWIDRTSLLQTLSPLFAASGLVHLTLVVLGLEFLK